MPIAARRLFFVGIPKGLLFYGHLKPLFIYFAIKRDIHPPASEASRELANLTERKNPQTP